MSFYPLNGSLLVGVLGGLVSMGPGPGGHGRAAVDEPRVTANWNEYASLVQLLSPRLTRIGFRRLGIA